jgi:hypothetical protein
MIVFPDPFVGSQKISGMSYKRLKVIFSGFSGLGNITSLVETR